MQNVIWAMMTLPSPQFRWMAEKKIRGDRGYQEAEGAHSHTTIVGNRFVVVRHSHTWSPPTDVYEENDRLVVLVEIAGMQRGKFNVVLEERHLTIAGKRPTRLHNKAAFHQLEVRHGEFRVDIDLPWSIDEDRVEASYDDGFLHVELDLSAADENRVVVRDGEYEYDYVADRRPDVYGKLTEPPDGAPTGSRRA